MNSERNQKIKPDNEIPMLMITIDMFNAVEAV